MLGRYRRCAFNSAVQLMALMPGISKHLKQLCSSGADALTLHKALDKQLDELATAAETKKPAMLDGFLAAMDKVAGLSEMVQRTM